MRCLLLIGAILALPAAAFAQSCELKIGAMGPMSGSGAQWGLSMKSAAEMAAAEVNQNGGVKINGKTCKVSVVSYDSKYTPDGAAAGANALAGDGIHIIIGPVGSVENAAVKPVAARNKQLAWNAAYATNAEEAKYPLMFQVSPPPAVWADLVVKRAMKTFPMKKVVIVVPNDQTGTDVASVDAKAYQSNGVTASTEFYQRGTTNFAPIITRVLAGHPDAVDTASSAPGDAGVIVKQLRLAGFTGPIGRVGGPGTAEILRVCGGMDVLKDFYWYEAVPTDDPKVQAMDTEFHKLLGRTPLGAPHSGRICRAPA